MPLRWRRTSVPRCGDTAASTSRERDDESWLCHSLYHPDARSMTRRACQHVTQPVRRSAQGPGLTIAEPSTMNVHILSVYRYNPDVDNVPYTKDYRLRYFLKVPI